MATGDVPEICILDPDGDIVEHLTATGSADRHPSWACYHTHLHVRSRRRPYGVVGSAVGASFAVLVAEQLFASGRLISMTSATDPACSRTAYCRRGPATISAGGRDGGRRALRFSRRDGARFGPRHQPMGQVEGDFEKGANGASPRSASSSSIARSWLGRRPP